ncbi:MAG: thiol reductant ABC exporter subunit CydC [Vicinamibacterales bacterium]|nr:thiol reductant ABC exporter subunit CydC [Vicinamibacterales bacterium]
MTAWAVLARLAFPERRRFALGIGLMTITVGASVALMGTSAWLIATAALHPSIAVLQVAVVGVRFFGITRGVGRYLERLVSHDVTLRLLARLRVHVFLGLAPLVPAVWHRRSSGDMLARILADVDTIEHAYLRLAGPAATAAVVIAATALALAWIAPVAGLIALAGLLLAGIGVPLLAWLLGRRAGAAQMTARAALHAALVDGVQGAADLLAFDAGARHVARLDDVGRQLEAAQQTAVRASSTGAALVSWLTDVTAVAVIIALAPLVDAGAVSGVALTVATLLTLASFEAVAPLVPAAQSLSATHAAAARVLADTPRPASAIATGVQPIPGHPLVQVSSLTFTYPGAGAAALRDVSLTLDRGRLVALVGESGAGKSTLVQVLLTFWAAPPGTIRLAGHDLSSLDGDAARAQVAWMAQRTDVFTGTLAENVRLARPDASDEAVDAALIRAGLGSTVAKWPAGRDTWIGERGMTLSGGERQRLALARVLLRDAPIVLLDEPTSQVDPETERRLVEEFVGLARDRAVLLVTHRVAGLERADEILVLAEGAVVERGTFAELAARPDGRFQRLLATSLRES